MGTLFVVLLGNLFLSIYGLKSDVIQPGFKYGEAFKHFIDENGYKGGATGVLLGNRLGFAEGYGRTITGHNVHTETLLPASGISKIITALTVLKLVEEGSLQVSDKVFGENGKLARFTPKPEEITDTQILKITVDDLLRHAGGWDSEISAQADPMYNEFLVEGNHHVVNITKELELERILGTHDVIQFMAAQKLDFAPGTKSRVSNLGYAMLGRIIEEVTDQAYEHVVKEKLLVSCGMWHTRLGPEMRDRQRQYKNRSTRQLKAELRERHETIGEYYAYTQTHLVDSCLGWFSNVYDIMRLAQCIDGSRGYRFLNKTTTEYMTSRSRAVSEADENWFGAGFQVHNQGAIWVGDEPHSPDVVFLHRNLNRHPDGHVYSGEENDPMSWTFLFEGKPTIDAPLKQLSRAMVESESHWPETDAYLEDISDKLLTLGTTTKLIKLKVEEHRVNMYLTTIKRIGFNVVWINAYTNDKSTFVAVIAEKDEKADGEYVLSGLERESLVQKKLELQEQGYNMTFFQNYKSSSHGNKYMFLAVFHKGAFRNDSHIVYGIQHFDKPYKTLLELYEEKGFRPLVQSIEYQRDDALLSFILESENDKEKDQKPLYASEENLSETRLEKYVYKYAKEQKKLIYLDESNHRGKPKFSALFKKTRMSKWLFSQGLSLESLLTTITEKQKEGFLPSIIVGYSTKAGILKYVTYMEKP